MATQNPPGSSDPRDLVVNAGNLDVLVTSTEALSQDDRLGVPRKTWHGMEVEFDQAQGQRADAFDSDQADRASEFSSTQLAYRQAIRDTGLQVLGEYAAGIEFTDYNQAVRLDGEFWKPAASTVLPYTTTGAGMPESDAFVAVGDAVLRQDLADPAQGAAKVARGVVAVESIADLLALPAGQRREDLRYLVKGYHAGTVEGGGVFYWDEAGSDAEDGGLVFAVEGASGRFKRLTKGADWFLADWGVRSTAVGETEFASANTAAYARFYAYARSATNAAGGRTAFLPEGYVYFTHPVVANGFVLAGASANPARLTRIVLTEANPTTLIGVEDLGATWGIIDYSTVIAPCIVASSYYSGLKDVRILSSVQCGWGVFGGIARYHHYDNLHITVNCTVGFESQGGFLTQYGDMEISGAANGIKIGPGPIQTGGNTPTFGRLWVREATGYAFYSYGMTELDVHQLYIEGCTGGPFIYLRTASNFNIGTINIDSCTISAVAILRARGSTGTIGGVYLENVSSPNSTPFLGEDGAGNDIEIGTLRVRNSSGVITAKSLGGSGTNKFTFKRSQGEGAPLIGTLSQNSVDSSTLFFTSLARKFGVVTGDANLYNIVLATVKWPVAGRFSVDVQISGSSRTGFSGTEKINALISTTGDVTQERYAYSDLGGSSAAMVLSVREIPGAPEYREIVGSRNNTSYSDYSVNVRANGRGVLFLKAPFYTYY